MNTATPAVEVMPPLPAAAVTKALKLLPFEYRWFYRAGLAEQFGYSVEASYFSDGQMHAYAKTYAASLLAQLEAARAREAGLREALENCAGTLEVFVKEGSAAPDSVIWKNVAEARAALSQPGQQGEQK